MVWIAGLVIGGAVLYGWLLGHWFVRVLVFLLMAAPLGLLGSGFTGGMGPMEHNYGWVGFLLGAALAWPVSGIPLYLARRKHASFQVTLTGS